MKSKTKTYIYIVSVAIIVIVIGVLVFIWSRGFGQGPTSSSALPVGAAQYSNSDLGFSFQYPAEAAIQEPPTDGGFMVTVTDAKASESLQIFVTPFSDAPSVLTADYIKEQVPDLVINNPKQISVGTSVQGTLVQGLPSVQGLPLYNGVSFTSTQDNPPVLEYWFTTGTGAAEHLYQMTATAGSADLAKEILESFKLI